jgi:hypothetical protein
MPRGKCIKFVVLHKENKNTIQMLAFLEALQNCLPPTNKLFDAYCVKFFLIF